MRLVKAAEMREMDLEATRRYGIPGLILMENAGLAVVDVIINDFFRGKPQGKKVVIIAGPGNNGGDGFVVGRHLFNKGVLVQFLITTDPQYYRGDAAVNLKIINDMGLPCQVLQPDNIDSFKAVIKETDLVVDALFGTGFKGIPREPLSSLIRTVNAIGNPVLAVDIPSGIEADTGSVAGECIKAVTTVTMGMPKIGLYLDPGAQYTGEVVVGDISFPPELKSEEGGDFYLVDEEMVARVFPVRLPTQHKGDFGHVVVIGGTRGYTGAAALASNAALRGGAGLVTAVIPEQLYPVAAVKLTEAMTYPAPGSKGGGFSSRCRGSIQQILDKAAVLAVGPGFGQEEETAEFLEDLLLNTSIPLVLDADALNILARKKHLLTDVSLAEQRQQWVLTPHPGEMARLCGVSISEIQADRLECAAQASREWGVVVVLKGARTIIAGPEGPLFINPTGNPGLASGGTGDVLAGLIASFMAQGLNAEEAAYCGVFIHGQAADQIAINKGGTGMIAGDLLEEIPVVIENLLALKERGR
ncbi:MAG TPA: NAD(P)H-hydrate dehydratase [Syntrophomonadaceae bacterium]|nr:NAD(P)H-hydrate dehydratase [Syntrophomonadaceae bacterium]